MSISPLLLGAMLQVTVHVPGPGVPLPDFPESASGIAAGMRAEFAIVRQVEAWNRGDLEGALDVYCPKEDIVWVNRSGVSRGFAQFARSMRSDFAGGSARMGRMEAKVEQEMSLAENKALVTLSWSIRRDGKRLMGGISTQLWAWCGDRMRVVYEHAS